MLCRFLRALPVGGIALAVAACAPAPGPAPGCSSPVPIGALVDTHRARYAAMQLTDLYKLLQHATLGSEHAVTDTTMARRWMEREVEGLAGPFAGQGDQPVDPPAEPLVDTLGLGGRYARVHLRPFVARGGDPGRLLHAFVRTGAVAPGTRAALHCAEAAVVARAREGSLPWSADSLTRYFAAQRAGGDSAVHHSPPYRARHLPAYRVVALELLDDALEGVRP